MLLLQLRTSFDNQYGKSNTAHHEKLAAHGAVCTCVTEDNVLRVHLDKAAFKKLAAGARKTILFLTNYQSEWLRE